jgi:ribosomal protein S18 acetylase RimI-like enzyme
LTDGYVAPAFRRTGVGTLLLHRAETVARQTRRDGGAAVLAGNASTVQADRAALLAKNGYLAVFSMVEMELARPVSSTSPLPKGLLVRDAVVDDAAALIGLSERAWAGRPYFISPTVDQFRAWLRRSDLSLFHVATTREQIVGFVASSPHDTHAEIDDVQVDPDWQRRGLASALLTRNLELLTARGARPIRLHTEGDDPAGALSLYRRRGFDVVREYHRYRKPL